MRRRFEDSLEEPEDSFSLFLANAPDDDEPFDPADVDGVDDEPPIPHDVVVQRFQ